MTKRKLKLATRKWERQFNRAVAQSIAKTLTEPITNSYDSYKRAFGAGDATTGLVDRMLSLGVGTHVVHEDLVKELPLRSEREVLVRLSTVTKAAVNGVVSTLLSVPAITFRTMPAREFDEALTALMPRISPEITLDRMPLRM